MSFSNIDFSPQNKHVPHLSDKKEARCLLCRGTSLLFIIITYNLYFTSSKSTSVTLSVPFCPAPAFALPEADPAPAPGLA